MLSNLVELIFACLFLEYEVADGLPKSCGHVVCLASRGWIYKVSGLEHMRNIANNNDMRENVARERGEANGVFGM